MSKLDTWLQEKKRQEAYRIKNKVGIEALGKFIDAVIEKRRLEGRGIGR